MRADLPIPGPLWGDHPERRLTPSGSRQRCAAAWRDAASRLADAAGALRHRRDARWLAKVQAAQSAALSPNDEDALHAVRAALLRHGLTEATLVPAFALVSRTAERCLGVRPFGTQLIAARAVLDNRLAEMATGEGKTLAVGLAAAVGALTGMPVHVVTANDYLVVRDAQRLQPLYAALDLAVGWVTQGDQATARARAYACDVMYITAQELVFDYLRDGQGARPVAAAVAGAAQHRAPPARAMLRGLCMAIVDEADSVLVDEARVPLILSQQADPTVPPALAQRALGFARTLHDAVDFGVDRSTLAATLTVHGRDRLDRTASSLADASASPAWRTRLQREHLVCTALAALHAYQRDRHYLVRDGKVEIIDETTGRVAVGRAWSNGLQQLIELKEGCPPSPSIGSLAQLTYQRFFPRYLRLGGFSGTLREARSELMSTYGLAVRRVPLRRPCLRRVEPARLYPDHEALWEAVAGRIGWLHRGGRPVLVATDSVGDAQALSRRLVLLGLPHALLHARNDAEEARVVAQAGQRGAITVSTNMSGRGTDIELGPGVRELGGLHVVCCQLNGARRIDRQLAGRAARQGDPGSVETMLSLDTALLARALPAPMREWLRSAAARLPSWAVRSLARTVQRAEEQRERLHRKRLFEEDERSARQLGFCGPAE